MAEEKKHNARIPMLPLSKALPRMLAVASNVVRIGEILLMKRLSTLLSHFRDVRLDVLPISLLWPLLSPTRGDIESSRSSA